VKRVGCVLLAIFGGIVAVFVALVLVGRALPDAKSPAAAPSGGIAGGAAALARAPAPPAGMLAVPVAGVARSAITDSWEDPREGGARQHHGTDIMAPGGTTVLAAAPGTIEKLFQSAAGGTTLYVRSPDRRWVYYYAHLSGYAPGVREGLAVKAGDPIAYVGDTGNAGAGNFHLHFGLGRTAPDQRWYQAQEVNPYPYLAGKPSQR